MILRATMGSEGSTEAKPPPRGAWRSSTLLVVNAPTWLVALVLVLASFRITRLITADVLLDRPRTWLAIHLPAYPAKLITCAYCAGFWISALVVVAWYFGGKPGWVVLVVFAVAGAQALLSAIDTALGRS